MKRSAIARSSTPMKRSPMRRKPTPTMSAAIRNKVKARSRGICEACTPVCTYTPTHVHHKAGRGKHLDTLALLLHCCDACHRFIHANPSESYERGWLIRRNA